jgi:opacity protein-like surface antigen
MGLGFGFANVDASYKYTSKYVDYDDDIIKFDEDFEDTTHGYNFIIGISYNINQSFVIDAAYRYVRFVNMYQYIENTKKTIFGYFSL